MYKNKKKKKLLYLSVFILSLFIFSTLHNFENASAKTNIKPYSKTGTSSKNKKVHVKHSGKVYCNADPVRMTLKKNVIKGYVNSSAKTPTKIQLSQTISFKGLGVSVSWPAAVSIGSSETSGSWSSLAYKKKKSATAYVPNVSAKAGMYIYHNFKVTIKSRSDIYYGNKSYGTSVSSTVVGDFQ